MPSIDPESSPPAFTVRRVAVGSSNPVKIEAVRAVVDRIWRDTVVDGIAVPSDVPDQPWGDDETIAGARTRAERALAAGDADLAVGIEGGVVAEAGGRIRTCAWAVAISRDGRAGTGGSLAMPLPPGVARAVRGGLELGRAMDLATGEQDTKRGAGAVGILTGGLIDRQRAYEVLVSYALAPWLSGALWR